MIANLDEVNLYFIQKIAAQIKKIGEMNPTSIHRYAIMLEMGADIADISGKLQAATRLTQQQMAELFHTSRSNIVEHIGHIYEEGELDEVSTCRKFRQVEISSNSRSS